MMFVYNLKTEIIEVSELNLSSWLLVGNFFVFLCSSIVNWNRIKVITQNEDRAILYRSVENALSR